MIPRTVSADRGFAAGSRATKTRAALNSERARVWTRRCGIAAGLGVLYALLHQIGAWFQVPSGGAAFYPPAGLSLAVLALTPRRTWPLWLAVFAAAHFGIDVANHRPEPQYLVYTLADVVEPLVGALLLVAAVHRFHGPRAALVSFAVFPVVAAPFLAGVLGTTLFVIIGEHIPWWTNVWSWWVGDALGVLVVGGLILAWARPMAFEDRAPLAAVIAVAAVGAGAILLSGVLWHYPLVYIVLPGLVWAAFVGGGRGVTTVGAAAAFAAYWVAITGRAGRLFGSAHPGQQLQLLQLFIAVTFLTGLVLAVEIAERRRSEHDRATIERATLKVAEAERSSIAQDTHDIVGHGLSAMLLQIGAARRLLDQDPAAASQLLQSSETLGRKAAGDLDVALSLLGHDQAPESHGLDELPDLITTLHDAGLPVELRIEGERGDISTLVDWSGYRIAREALTNVLKHAPGAATTVTIRYRDADIQLSVVNDTGPSDGDRPHEDRRGIIGMRERAAALGGTLKVGPTPGPGFAVEATLPIRPQ